MRSSLRLVALVAAGVVACTTPGIASADDAAAPVFARVGSAADLAPNSLYAGYTSSLGTNKSISGTLTLPVLGTCAVDGGVLVAIELANSTGSDYVDGGSYSTCYNGDKKHVIVIESSAEGQIVVGQGHDGDKISVVQRRLANGDVTITVKNVTTGSAAVTQVITGATVEVATAMHWGQISVGGNPVPTLDYNRLPISGVVVGGRALKSTAPIRYDYVPDSDVVLKTSVIGRRKNFSTENVVPILR